MALRDAALLEVWRHARDVVGLLGPGPVEAHLEHAQQFVPLVPERCTQLLDLGSGAGVPGLLLATRIDGEVFLLDGSEKRAQFLRWAVSELRLSNVTVIAQRAEEAGRSEALREQFDVVTSRSFGAPGVTAECAAPLMAADASLLVSEPPDGADRWPSDGIAVLGLEVAARGSIVTLKKVGSTPDKYPRRTGIPSKRPLF